MTDEEGDIGREGGRERRESGQFLAVGRFLGEEASGPHPTHTHIKNFRQ